mmetsp:Transcript_9319/g.13167  ORF Transcript_9319/g.13167 Transcript_9319/m.13167 type:complete len:118 (-) Transcript_9319:181-534(-)
MAPKAMKAMKAMKPAAMKGKAMTQTESYSAIAEKSGVSVKETKAVVEAMMEVAAAELKSAGAHKLAGCLNMKLKKKPATKARKGVNPFTGEKMMFKAKPASQTVRCLPLSKFKAMVN